MRGQIDPSGYGRKKKRPYSHGTLPDARKYGGESEEIVARDVCSAIWFEVGRSMAKYLEEWQIFRDESKDDEKEEAGMGTPEERWRLHRDQVIDSFEQAQNHCDLTDNIRCVIDAFSSGDFEEFANTDQWDTATEELDKFMSDLRDCLYPIGKSSGYVEGYGYESPDLL